MAYAVSQLFWGLRLDQLGRHDEAARRFRRTVEISGAWLDALAPEVTDMALGIRAVRAAALAKLGRVDEAAELAASIVVPLREQESYWAARLTHVALGVCLRARGDLAGARREFVAAEQLCAFGARTDERMFMRYEMAMLTAEVTGVEASRGLIDLIREQIGHLWELRLQRLAMLRQARQRE